MSEHTDADGFDFDLDRPMTLQDYVEIIANDIDEAVGALSAREIQHLCRTIRKKIDCFLDEDRPAAEHDRGDRWWDR